VEEIIKEARRRAKVLDGHVNSLTLRLRELGGLIRAAGDMAAAEGDPLIEPKHIAVAIKRNKSVEEQIQDRYGSYSKGLGKDISTSQKERSPYYFWNEHGGGDQMFS
jgi:ATP-dependent Lon protease